ncbi:MAG: MobA/MobL family protein, partial [Oscillospiraceae bacterium]|nr:MobA/MobL family protein [Oscillospiraceae bacterium]
HGHIMLTVRPLDDNGKWQYKTEKEYLCVRDGEERGFTAKEFKAAQAEGWEKQYRYKVGRKKVYMAPSEAEAKGLTRLSKHPKSSKYGRQNPISERWNSEEQLVLWRKAWADVTNRFLERAGNQERVDHRSHAERGLDEQPTVHEGITARAMEAAGIVSDRCELNRQIKADNLLLRTLKAQVRKLLSVVKNTVVGIARALETVRKNLLIFRYHVLHSGADKKRIADTLDTLRPDMARYEELAAQIKDTTKERRALLDEKKATPPVRVIRHHELARGIAKLTEDLEELKTERTMLLSQYAGTDGTLGTGVQAVRNRISFLEATLQKVERRESKYEGELKAALAQYQELRQQTQGMDADALDAARQAVRPDMEREAYRQAREVYGKRYDSGLMEQSRKDVAVMLDEERALSIQAQVQKSRNQCGQKQAEKASIAQNQER